MLHDNIRKFIENNIELIEANAFDELYDKAKNDLYFSQGIGTMTRALQRADIDPLAYMDKIPYCFLYGDYRLKTLDIPNNIQAIESVAFANCTDLQIVTCGKNLKKIGYGSFEGCVELKDIQLNEGLLIIDQYAFRGSPVGVITLPKSLITIDKNAFQSTDAIFRVYRDSFASEWAKQNKFPVEFID